MKHFLILLLSIPSLVFSQSFYDTDQVQSIEINFEQSNWDQLMDAQKAGDEDYIMAKEVVINGIVYDSVGVKYKGNSTYRANQTKNPLHIELDTYKDQDHEGYTDIKLSNVYNDPSFIREVLSYNIIRNYMDAPLSNYANITINGDLIGLYSNSEAISKKFVNSRFGSKSNTFVKCNPVGGAGPQSSALPNLVYMGEDSASYDESYEIKSDYGWNELIDLCDTLSNHTDAVEAILDVDRTLWMHALNNVLVNLDSYLGQFAQNYYLYRSDYGQFMPVIWDLNESIGVFSSTGIGNLNNTNAKIRMDHLLHDNSTNYPLVSKLLQVPTYKRMYLAHMKTILQEQFESGLYETIAADLQAGIDTDVSADPNKFYTYNNFISNLNADISQGGGGGPMGRSTPGITTLIGGRSDYLLGLSDFTASQAAITEVGVSGTPLLNEETTITARVSDANEVTLAYRKAVGGPFSKVSMFDDGMHGDDQANDGIYGGTFAMTALEMDYYIYAENSTIGTFSPARAQHEFYEVRAGNLTGDVVINEFMASNDITAADQDGDFDDWVELYNNGDAAVDLSGYFLSDKTSDISKWTIPDGTMIEGKGYLVIWLDEDDEQEGLHANFKLSAGGEDLIFSDTDTIIQDQIAFGEQTTDISYGRFPNGSGDFQTMNPTFGIENDNTTSTNDVQLNSFNIYPNPTQDKLYISLSKAVQAPYTLEIYDLNGALQKRVIMNAHESSVDCSFLHQGVYLLKTEFGSVRFVKM